MSVGSLDALKVRALLERVCSVPTTLTPDELSRVCAAQLSFAEVVSLAAQLTAVIQAHEITTPAAPAAGAGRPMSARRNGNTLGAQIHAVEHLHKSLQRTARVQLANQALAATVVVTLIFIFLSGVNHYLTTARANHSIHTFRFLGAVVLAAAAAPVVHMWGVL